MSPPKLPLDYVLVNCAACGKELSASHLQARRQKGAPPLVARRIKGRPYCVDCLDQASLPARSRS